MCAFAPVDVGGPDAGFAAAAHLVLVVLLSRQVARSRSPAGLSRLSRWSFLLQAMVDAVSFAGVRRSLACVVRMC
jgi:hypothetical protein